LGFTLRDLVCSGAGSTEDARDTTGFIDMLAFASENTVKEALVAIESTAEIESAPMVARLSKEEGLIT